MDRLTTDNPQDNVGNMFNLVFAKDNKAWMRSCGDDDKDCTLSSFVEQICKKCGCESDVDSTNTIDFSEKMGDCACGMCCPVANAYFGLAQAAELRERLKQYEDALERWGIAALSVAELDKWHDRMVWHVEKINEYEFIPRAGIPLERVKELVQADVEQRIVVLTSQNKTLMEDKLKLCPLRKISYAIDTEPYNNGKIAVFPMRDAYALDEDFKPCMMERCMAYRNGDCALCRCVDTTDGGKRDVPKTQG